MKVVVVENAATASVLAEDDDGEQYPIATGLSKSSCRTIQSFLTEPVTPAMEGMQAIMADWGYVKKPEPAKKKQAGKEDK